MYHFCTITTASHLYKVKALFDSLFSIDQQVTLHVLCIDSMILESYHAQVNYYSLSDMSISDTAKGIITKYRNKPDELRWSLKPVMMEMLLGTRLSKVIYLDNDIYVAGSFHFLFELLDTHDFLLTPHHYPSDPTKAQNWLEANYKVGLYNAGFIGANMAAIPILKWWASCCLYRCEKSLIRGLFDDQKYLDLVPVKYDKAHIVRHKGCNVAEWNRATLARTIDEQGQVRVAGDPLVFIHFNSSTVRAVIVGEEPLLKATYNNYYALLLLHKPTLLPADLYQLQGFLDTAKYWIWKWATDRGW